MLRLGVSSREMKTQMRTFRTARQLAVFLWLAITLLVAVTQPLLGLFLLFLIPVWFFFSEVLSLLIPRKRKTCRALPFAELLVFSPRPPPIQ
jgi:hypothetical protein